MYYNYAVRELESEDLSGLSVFYKNASGDVFHTYSTYARGDELVDGAYMLLDLTPLGRNETGPYFNLGDWVRHRDRYEPAGRPEGGDVMAPGTDPERGCAPAGGLRPATSRVSTRRRTAAAGRGSAVSGLSA